MITDGKILMLKFLQKKVNDFYSKSEFADFFHSKEPVYVKAVQQMQDILDNGIDFEWFDNFYGTTSGGKYRMIVSLIIGWNNYGGLVTVDENGE